MKLISLNVGLPREVSWNGETVSTGIFKEPVEGRVRMRTLNLEGDRQADLTVHGGPDKAVYAYPFEHYAFWQREMPDVPMPWGVFGENLTTEGLLEETVYVGDRLRIGSAEVVVTQPRLPCYKLGIKFGRDDIIPRFLESGRSGFYLAVRLEGEVEVGDTIEIIERDPHALRIVDVLRLFTRQTDDTELLRRALLVDALPDGFRNRFRRMLEKREESIEN